MLQNIISGAPNLAPVLNRCCQDRKAAGKDLVISLDKHGSLLLEQVQIYNNANTHMCSSYCCAAAVREVAKEGMEFKINAHEGDDYDDHEPDLADVLVGSKCECPVQQECWSLCTKEVK